MKAKTPRRFATPSRCIPFRTRPNAILFVNYRYDTLAIVVLFLHEAGPGILSLTVTAEPT